MKELSAITRCYDLILWLVPAVDKFPRTRKFTLGGRIEAICLETLEALIEAKYTRGKADILRRVNLRLETLRYLIRLSGFTVKETNGIVLWKGAVHMSTH